MSACSENLPFQSEKAEEFILPEFPENFLKNSCLPEPALWKITLITAENTKTAFISGTSDSFKLRLIQNQPAAILAKPVFHLQNYSDGTEEENSTFWKIDFFKPAGTIFPFAKRLSWNQGFTAEIFRIFINLSKQENSTGELENFLSCFNWEKFMELIDQNCKDETYNPWNLNTAKISTSILCENFKASLLSQKSCSTFYSSDMTDLNMWTCFSAFFPENFYNLKKSSELKIFTFNPETTETFLKIPKKTSAGSFEPSQNLQYLISYGKKGESLLLANTEIPLYTEN